MLKEIKIFLGSSIYDFKNERKDLSDFIQTQSKYFEKAYKTKLVILMCEDIDPAMTKERKQEKLNDLIRQSDICIFMFDKKVGIFTEEEFDLACNTFKANNKPIIYPYFKVIGENEAEQSLLDFKAKIYKKHGLYPINFEDIDTIKLRLLHTLNETAFNGVFDIKLDGDKILLDGNETFSTENIAEFTNNVLFQKLANEFKLIEEHCNTLQDKFLKKISTTEETIEFINLVRKKSNLTNQINALRKNIFDMLLRLNRDELRGEITQLQREAYRLFEAGDLEGANNILNVDQIIYEYQQHRKNRIVEQKKAAEIYIQQLSTKIDILSAIIDNDNRFNEIEDIYDQITQVAFEQKVEINVIFDYAYFLYDQNKLEKAYTIAKRLENLIADDDNEEENARVYHLLATISAEFPEKKDETIEYYDKVIAIRERLAKFNRDRFEPDLAMSYNNAGNFYKDQGQPQKAEDFCNKAIAIIERLAKSNPDRFEPNLAMSYNNAGNFYKDQGQPQKAEDFYNKAIAIRERLAKSNPDRFEPDLATSYNNAGIFYNDQGQPQKAEDFYNKAIAIRERLAKSNPDRFEPDLATSYNNAGVFYQTKGQPQKAENFYIKAIAIREKLAKSNPDRFEPDFARSYSNAGNFYLYQGQLEKAESFHMKAIIIFEKLAHSNPDRFEPDLSHCYNNTAAFYDEQGNTYKAEDFYNKAIAIRERLAKSNPDRFEPDLAMTYFNYAFFKEDNDLLEKTFKLAKKHPFNPYCKHIINELSE